jgi:hypothetical protein
MSDYMKDLDEVRALVQLYVDGADGDVDKMRQAFHPTATMMDTYVPNGHLRPHRGIHLAGLGTPSLSRTGLSGHSPIYRPHG